MTATAIETTSLNDRKLNLIQRLTTVQDEILVQQLEAILFSEKDWWDDLTEEEHADLLEGMDDLNSGRTETYESFTSRMNARFQ